ncbi:FAD-dependent monooxygenase [Streptomyces sp. RB6PN25]|uniref:FAD-dependent monooxygenase n=1 Tax=Streptomyces humicola TaxID=2953240 RepID=A0ABT1PTB6_9ACTN|nr:NAD(P)/FAD-dependent oxidoreductase [Streptomyces humicola]MCQ4080912.1 FAD-dependent monooxygenase [Streptomyces humicola]
MYDVIVVGARCAGAPTAMLFARRGYRVLMVDRARFPRDTLSTLYIHQPGVALLHRWGLLDAVAATGCPPIEHAVHQVGDVRLEGCSWPVDGVRAAYAPRRHLLDGILVRAAVAAGVEFREGHTLEDLVLDGDRVVGVRCRTGATWRTFQEHARLVVGADGMRSRVAACAGAPVITGHPLMTCVYYSFWEDVPAGFEAYGAPGRWTGCVPTNDGLTLVAAYFPQSEFDTVRADAQSAHLEAVRTVAPDLYARVAAGTRADRLYGSGEQRNYLRQAVGPGWALVGDAGHHKDSITARGITDAFQQAAVLVEVVGDSLLDEPRLRRALREYARRRDALVMDGYQDTLSVAKLRPERRLDVLRVLSADPVLTERFFATAAGASRSSELMTPDVLARLRSAGHPQQQCMEQRSSSI